MKNRFDAAAQTWDEKPTTQKLQQAIVTELLKHADFTDTMHVLDYGVGTGLLLFAIQPKVQHITAIDTSQGMRDVLQEKVTSLGAKNVTISHTDISIQELQESSYDMFVSSMTLHHIKDTRKFFEHAFLSLKNNGSKLILFDLVTEDSSFHTEVDDSIFHFGFNPDTITALMKSVGFSEVSVQEFYALPKKGKLYPIFSAVGTKK